MRDAIRMSIDHLKEKGKQDKKVLVVVTDGNDNSSLISLENLVKASQQSEVLIYAIGLLSEEERREANARQTRVETHCRGHRRPVVFPEGCDAMSQRSRIRWRTIFAISTSSLTLRECRLWTEVSARSGRCQRSE